MLNTKFGLLLRFLSGVTAGLFTVSVIKIMQMLGSSEIASVRLAFISLFILAVALFKRVDDFISLSLLLFAIVVFPFTVESLNDFGQIPLVLYIVTLTLYVTFYGYYLIGIRKLWLYLIGKGGD